MVNIAKFWHDYSNINTKKPIQLRLNLLIYIYIYIYQIDDFLQRSVQQ